MCMLFCSSSAVGVTLCLKGGQMSTYLINVKKLKSLKQCLTATQPTSHN